MALSKPQLRKQKEKLHRAELLREQNGKCAICDRNIIIVHLRYGQKVPPNSANLLHLESRLDPDRGQFGPHSKRHIVACPSCCFDYGKSLQDVLSPEEKWARSGRAPQRNPFKEYGAGIQRIIE